MAVPSAVIDTSVVVSGLLTGDAAAPTARLLDGMLRVRFPYLLSLDLLAEYRGVLLRPVIAERHGLDAADVDHLLAEIVTGGRLREPSVVKDPPPDPDDLHLWALLATTPGAVLATGDRRLIDAPPADASVIGPRAFLDLLGLDRPGG